MADDPLLTPKQVSEFLNIPVATLAQWRYMRTGPAYIRVGRMIRYQRADLDTFVTENRRER